MSAMGGERTLEAGPRQPILSPKSWPRDEAVYAGPSGQPEPTPVLPQVNVRVSTAQRFAPERPAKLARRNECECFAVR